MADFSFKIVDFSFKMAGFSFKIVDFNFKIVKMADFKSKWPVLILKADFSFALDPSRVHTQEPLCKPKCFRATWPGRALDPSRVHTQTASCVQSKAAKNGF